MIKNIISACCMSVSISLMTLPYGVPTYWLNPDGPPHVFYYSYFSDIPPFAGLNFFPIITALISIGVLIRFLVSIIINIVKRNKDSKPGKPTYVFLGTCLGASLLSWILFGALSLLSVVIFLLHAAVFILQFVRKKSDAVLMN